ncbi:MAG: hypothetical protein ACRDHF_10270 [Tepidiformaceae bacterium]
MNLFARTVVISTMASHPGPWERGGWLDLAYRLVTRISAAGCAFVVIASILWVAAGVAVTAWVFWDSRPPSQIDFDAEEWRAARDGDLRYRMRDDLLEDHEFEGRSEDEVLDLLGRGCRDCAHFGEGTLAYLLGRRPWTLFGFDTVWLVFEVDDAGTVTGHRTETVYD